MTTSSGQGHNSGGLSATGYARLALPYHLQREFLDLQVMCLHAWPDYLEDAGGSKGCFKPTSDGGYGIQQ